MYAILYTPEHQACTNYALNATTPIEIIDIGREQKINRKLDAVEVVFVKRGKINVSCSMDRRRVHAKTNEIFMLPLNCNILVTVDDDTQVIIFRLRDQFRFCERLAFEWLTRLPIPKENQNKVLPAHRSILMLADSLLYNINAGMHCVRYQEVKVTELLMMLRAYYDKAHLAGMVSQMIHLDIKFWNNVMSHIDQETYNNNVNELAKIAGYTTDAFIRRFTKLSGGKTPKQWLDDRKAEVLRREFVDSGTPLNLKELVAKYGFSDISHLRRFCIQKIGKSPTELRDKAGLIHE